MTPMGTKTVAQMTGRATHCCNAAATMSRIAAVMADLEIKDDSKGHHRPGGMVDRGDHLSQYRRCCAQDCYGHNDDGHNGGGGVGGEVCPLL